MCYLSVCVHEEVRGQYGEAAPLLPPWLFQGPTSVLRLHSNASTLVVSGADFGAPSP